MFAEDAARPVLRRLDRHLADIEVEIDHSRELAERCRKEGNVVDALRADGRADQLEGSLAAVMAYRTLLLEQLARQRVH